MSDKVNQNAADQIDKLELLFLTFQVQEMNRQ